MFIFNIATNRQPNETDNQVFARAMQETAPDLGIYFPEGGGMGPNQSYLISAEAWEVPDQIPSRGNITRSNVKIFGDGMYRTIIFQPDDADLMFMAHVDPSEPTALINNITFSDLSLIGNLSRRIDQTGYQYNEHNHLIRVAGVSNLRLERVEFKDFMGDGLNLSSPLRSLVPHNDHLAVHACRFDGVNNKNRNGISILDCNGWEITGCAFLNISDVSRASPGAIDIEPENSQSVIRAGKVYNCSFDNIGGYAVALLSNQTSHASGLEITYCSVRASKGVLAVQGFDDVLAANLYVDLVEESLLIRETVNTVVRNNTFRNADLIRLGGGTVGVTISNNGFVNCGRINGPVILQDDSVDGVNVVDNHIIDCGVQGLPSPLYFVQTPTGVVKSLRVNRNRVEAQTEPLKITDIGRIVGGRTNTSTNYIDVNRDGNTPTSIPNGVENLVNT